MRGELRCRLRARAAISPVRPGRARDRGAPTFARGAAWAGRRRASGLAADVALFVRVCFLDCARGGPFIVLKTKATDSRRCKVAGVEAGVESRVVARVVKRATVPVSIKRTPLQDSTKTCDAIAFR